MPGYLNNRAAKKLISMIIVLVMCFTLAVPVFAATATTTNTSLNLNGRSGPGTSYGIVVKIPPKSTVTTTGSTKNGFTQVVYNGKTCWVSSSYLKISSDNGKTAYTTNTSLNLNMRSSASTSSSVVKKIPPKSKITVYGSPTNGFYYASYNGTKGYVSSSYVSFSKPDSDLSYYVKNVGKVIANLNSYKTNLDGYTGIKGQCVWYVRNRGYEKLGSKGLTGIGGNANTWYSTADKKGLSIGSTPKSNSIACYRSGSYGHVIYVEYYDSSTKTVYFTEANCSKASNGQLQKATLSNFKKHNSGYQGCIYLQ